MEHIVVVSGNAVFGPFGSHQLAEEFAAEWLGSPYILTPLVSQTEIECQLEIEADFALAD
jgi:hypothetical protein